MPQRLHNRASLKPFRQELRSHGTAAEARLWAALQRRQLQGRKFRRQHSVGPYVLDFYCPEERLAIELDGSIHDDPTRRLYDEVRQRNLTAAGIRVLRFTNANVFEDTAGVLAAIAAHLRTSRHH